jgi:serine/threonine protein kinase
MILCDFGVSQFFENGSDQLKGTVGSFRFMAPEVVAPKKDKEMFGRPVDVWACGVTLYLLLTNKFPFLGNTIPTLQKAILSGEPDYSLIRNPDIVSLLRQMLTKDP